MGMAEEMARLTREVIASYEARISSVEQIIEATHEMLGAFRGQREAIRAELRETLARSASLRKRDFDSMMQRILSRQEERAQAVKETMRDYLAEQRAVAAALKEVLGRSEAGQIERVRGLLKEITAKREEGERKVRAPLAEFQHEHEELVRALRGLLCNGSSVRIREFKVALWAIQSPRWVGKPVPDRDREVEGVNNGDAQMRLLPGDRL